jgi:hypothetical protein
MEDIDWTDCPDVERVPDRVSGQWVVKDTRILAQGVIENADAGATPEEIGDQYSTASEPIAPAESSIMHGRMSPTRILLDQNTPLGLRRALSGYEVIPARIMGWATIENGDLIRAAEEVGFAILITCDRNVRYQQNLAGKRCGALVSLWP